MELTELTQTKTVSQLCQFCEDAQNDIREGFRHLLQAEIRLKQILESPNILPYHHSSDLAELHKEAHSEVRKQVWRKILSLSEIRSICSIEERNKIDKEFEGNKLPEITCENVHDFLESVRGRIPDMFDAAIKEVFEFLRPGQWCHHKTNSKFEIGRKVIIDWGMDTSYGMVSVNYNKEKFYHALDNVFHLLDGKGVAKYPCDLVTALKTAIRNKDWQAETEYFSCKWFRKGTLHIEFKRLDLVEELNKRAGGQRIKGQVA